MVDAALRVVAAKPPRHSPVVSRTRRRLSRVALVTDGGQRFARLRAIQTQPEWRLRAVVAPGARDIRRTDKWHQLLARHPPSVPTVRPASAAGAIAIP